VHHDLKHTVLLTIVALSVAFWVVAFVGTFLLLQDVNRQLRPKRLALIEALSVSDVTPRGRFLQKLTGTGVIGFLSGCLLCIVLKQLL
jgi:hypothetical protein